MHFAKVFACATRTFGKVDCLVLLAFLVLLTFTPFSNSLIFSFPNFPACRATTSHRHYTPPLKVSSDSWVCAPREQNM